MTATEPRPAAAVLIVDHDRFEADYVAAVLRDRCIVVCGPYAEAAAGLAALDEAEIGVAVIVDRPDAAPLAPTLAERRIPYLTLFRDGAPGPDHAALPVLHRPFAAYQIADWVLDTLRHREHASNSVAGRFTPN